MEVSFLAVVYLTVYIRAPLVAFANATSVVLRGVEMILTEILFNIAVATGITVLFATLAVTSGITLLV
jgi:hypothetical protein